MKPTQRDVETIAKEISRLGQNTKTSVFSMSKASEKLMQWAMSEPKFKTQLFRFVDVFPALQDDFDVLRHVGEYFDEDAPKLMGRAVSVAQRIPFGQRITRSVAHKNIERMARQFIAGSTATEALVNLKPLWLAGEAATVDLLGEKTVTFEESRDYATRVQRMLTDLIGGMSRWPKNDRLERDPWGQLGRVNVSVKPTALSPHFSPLNSSDGVREAFDLLVPSLDLAKNSGATIHLDVEHFDVKDETYKLLSAIGAKYPDGPQLGVVVQAYLRESYEDLQRLIEFSASKLSVPLQIRLVKGAYWDHETIIASAEGWRQPVYNVKEHTDANFERCVDLMVASAGKIRPAFASHNMRSLAYGIAAGRELPPGGFEIQLLYGMAEPVHAAVRKMGLRTRTYAPVGDLVPGMSYLVRRLLENTSNESFLRQRFAEGKKLDSLLIEPTFNSQDAGAGAAGTRDVSRTDTFSNANAPRGTNSPARVDSSDVVTELSEPFRNVSPSEFRRAEVRAAMQRAIDSAPQSFGFDAPVVIDGKPRPLNNPIISTDPGDIATVVCRGGRATTQDLEDAIAAAKRSGPAWARSGFVARAHVLLSAAKILRARHHDLAGLIVFESGKPWTEADLEVCEAIDFLEYYARCARDLSHGGEVISPPGETNSYVYQPRGIGVVISPWNFPLAIPCGMVCAALVAGNGVLFKPAEQTPGIAYRLFQALVEAGIPTGSLAFLPGVGEEVGAAAVSHPDVSFIAFTGSKAVGLEINRSASVVHSGQRQVKRVICEMGGKNAIIVDSDADLDQAVPGIIASAYGYAGQKCSAASRVIAIGDQTTSKRLADRLIGGAKTVVFGHPKNSAVTCGPLIDADSVERLKQYRELAEREGTILYEHANIPTGGNFSPPTIVETGNPSARVASEEIFGPFLCVLHAPTVADAIAIANDTAYALTGGIYSRSPANIELVANGLRAGNIYINRTITGAVVGRQPFGGFGLSGVGSKAGGPDYLLQFTDPRVITENTVRQGFAPQT